jgi:site-specific DNA-methyltransferase (cytosine-N4-specific)
VGSAKAHFCCEQDCAASGNKDSTPMPLDVAYKTALGKLIHGKAEDALNSTALQKYHGKIDLIFTSPPFPLNRKKKYGNLRGNAYIDWLMSFAPIFSAFLKPRGSIVMELGNAWEPGRPVMSTLPLRALLKYLDFAKLSLCQEFIYYNPARLPGPAQWVNVERIRVKDSYSHLWWMSATDRPKASNRRILKPYSDSMKELLERKKYNSGKRPSEHHIGKTSFFKKHKGAIPSNVITFSNTHSSSAYLNYCRLKKLTLHPARMPIGVAEFFIKFLTKPGDLVLDPFAGSNTTGAAAEALSRKWISIELNKTYVKGSRGRFEQNGTK